MTTGPAPLCAYCRHFRNDADALVCDAYPGGIPDPIIDNQVDHREQYAGDGGIRFDPANDAGRRYADRLFRNEEPLT